MYVTVVCEENGTRGAPKTFNCRNKGCLTPVLLLQPYDREISIIALERASNSLKADRNFSSFV